MKKLCRNQQLKQLGSQTFDILVIGGGATGAGIALDAASRGLSVALVERNDFASGTSSHSSKLIHGGVRYLEAAVTRLDLAQWRLVREALRERAILLDIAPHLIRPLRTLVPARSWYQLLRHRIGLWLYDRAAGRTLIAPSTLLSCQQMLASFPHLESTRLKGGVAYHDASFDDARMVISLLLTAVQRGAVIANHMETEGFEETNGRLSAARVTNRLDGSRHLVRARIIINATGPYSDHLRQLEHPANKSRLTLSRGSHLVLDKSWSPANDALLIPSTSDGRVLFVLPWQGHTLIGTTDVPASIQDDLLPARKEEQYLLDHLQQWFAVDTCTHNILARWAGLRPLIATSATDTAGIVREHLVETGRKGLVSVLGGKWTTYRKMAEEAVDHAIVTARLQPSGPCVTRTLKLLGTEGYTPGLAGQLMSGFGLAEDIALHLVHAYGGLAQTLLEHAGQQGHRRLLAGHPYIRAEIAWAREREMAVTNEDFLLRRLRIGMLDEQAACRLAARIALET